MCARAHTHTHTHVCIECVFPCVQQVANFHTCKYPSGRFCNEFFISLRVRSEDGTPDALHSILNNTYVVRKHDGTSTKVIIRNRAQLLSLLTCRFGLRAPDLDRPDLTRFLFEQTPTTSDGLENEARNEACAVSGGTSGAPLLSHNLDRHAVVNRVYITYAGKKRRFRVPNRWSELLNNVRERFEIKGAAVTLFDAQGGIMGNFPALAPSFCFIQLC